MHSTSSGPSLHPQLVPSLLLAGMHPAMTKKHASAHTLVHWRSQIRIQRILPSKNQSIPSPQFDWYEQTVE